MEQVYIPQKYENGDWRKTTGREAEYLFRRSILPVIGELRCRDLTAEHLRSVLRKLAGAGLSYESVTKVTWGKGKRTLRLERGRVVADEDGFKAARRMVAG